MRDGNIKSCDKNTGHVQTKKKSEGKSAIKSMSVSGIDDIQTNDIQVNDIKIDDIQIDDIPINDIQEDDVQTNDHKSFDGQIGDSLDESPVSSSSKESETGFGLELIHSSNNYYIDCILNHDKILSNLNQDKISENDNDNNDEKNQHDSKNCEDNTLIHYNKTKNEITDGEYSFDLFIPYSMKSAYSLYLDSDGLLFIEQYKLTFTSVLSLGVGNSHYFIETFLKLANSNEAILYLIASFGGHLLQFANNDNDIQNENDNNSNMSSDNYRTKAIQGSQMKYMQKSFKLISNKYRKDSDVKTKEDFFILFCYYLIMLSFEITRGDTKNWYDYLLKCKTLIENYGGLMKVMKDFQFSNDIKWAISDFQFHDVVSSKSVKHGTLYPIKTYENLTKFYINFGIDPFQNISRPIYLIWGKINNYSSKLNQEYEKIQLITESNELKNFKLIFYENIEKISSKIINELDDCSPNPENIKLLLDNSSNEFEFQMTFFELLNLTTKIHLNSSIKKLTPNNFEQQKLLIQCMERIDIIINTRMATALPIVFLICGVNCIEIEDRKIMIEYINKVFQCHRFGNYKRILDVIEEIWLRNINGDKLITWNMICEEKGWTLSIG